MKRREIPFISMGGLYQQDDLEAATNVIKAVIEKSRDNKFNYREKNAD
ncbi:MAG: hypothetical protein N2115_03070 [bacterium]|nr:hypothetical protein [bacterium]